MTSPVFIVVLSAVAAIIVAVVLLRARAPQQGYWAWFRDAFLAVRAERRARSAPAPRSARSVQAGHAVAEAVLRGADIRSGEEMHVADLLGMSDEGPAYQSAVDLRQVVRRVRISR